MLKLPLYTLSLSRSSNCSSVTLVLCYKGMNARQSWCLLRIYSLQ
jgi:hypothetical protein